MKVKVFDEAHELDLEDKINKFISNKEVIDIKFSTSVCTYGEDQIYMFSAIIIYL